MINNHDIELDIRYGRKCASVNGDIIAEDGYCQLRITVLFMQPITSDFAKFMQEYMEKCGVKGNQDPRYHVSKVYSNETVLYIGFTAGDEEYYRFEDYFEGEAFTAFMRGAITAFKEQELARVDKEMKKCSV